MVSSAQTVNSVTEVEKQQPSSRLGIPLQLTYLEGNSWIWEVIGVRLLIDPVLVGNLDFGIPWLYDASKKLLKEYKLEDLPEIDLLLITQNFDDHCHPRTLEPLSKMFPNLQVISTPNAEPTLSKLFERVIYLEPGHSTRFTGRNGMEITVRASAGPVLGPPWQRPENGYFIEAKDPKFSIYYEPHCVYNRSLLERERADVIVTPVVKQLLPLFTLVSGQEDAVELARVLQAKIVVPMKNGDLESKGFLTKLISSVGSVEDFRGLLQKSLPDVQILEPKPGVPLEVPVMP